MLKSLYKNTISCKDKKYSSKKDVALCKKNTEKNWEIKGALYSCYVFAHISQTGGSNLSDLLLLKSVINSAHINVNIMS